MSLSNLPSSLRLRAWASVNFSIPELHQDSSVGFLVVASLHHVHSTVKAEHHAAERQSGAPLTSSRLRCQTFGSFLHVVVGLGNRRVGLVAAGRADALVLVVDLGRRLQGLLESDRSDKGSGSPKLVGFPHFFRDVYPSILAELLCEDLFGKYLRDDPWARCLCRRVYDWRQRPRQIR